MRELLKSCKSSLSLGQFRKCSKRQRGYHGCPSHHYANLVSVAATSRSADHGDGPSTSDRVMHQATSKCSRRHLALGAAVLITTLTDGSASQASKTITLRDGSEVVAYEHGMSLAIVALRGSVPSHWALEFKNSIGRYCGFSLDQRPQLADIFKELSDTSGSNKRSAGVADVATLGDTWLAAAIQRRLVQPIPAAESYRWYRMLPPRMRQLVRRNAQGLPDPGGAVYGVPYRWGCTLIAYRRDRLVRRGGRPLLDWSDLLQPTLEGRVAMLDDPRELLAAAMRSLGVSPNASAGQMAAAGVSEEVLRDRVAAFRRQVKLFSSRDHVRALLAGDVWAVVGYSQDLVMIAERSGNMELVAPVSGTQLWADVWAVPAGARGGHRQMAPSPLLPVWFEFTLSPGRIAGQPGLKAGAPPALLPATTSAQPASEHLHHLRRLQAARDQDQPGLLRGAAEQLEGLAKGLPLLRPFLRDPRVGGDEGERVWDTQGAGAGTAGSGPASSAAVGAETPGQQPQRPGQPQEVAGSEAEAAGFPAVELHGDNGYLPPEAVLSRSEFLMPLDEDTMELFRRVLLA